MDGSAQLTEVRFSRKRQGYDPDEVDNFLERVGEKVYELQEKVRAATQRAEAAERRAAEAEARAEAAESQAGAAVPGAGQEGAATADTADLEETLKRTLVLAQRTADTAIAEARAEAERIVAEANATAERLARDTDAACKRKLDEAERQAQQRIEAASGPIKTEVLRLEERQQKLVEATTALDAHLEAQRARLRDALATLQAVVDDPARFSTVPAPTPVAPDEQAAALPPASEAHAPDGSPSDDASSTADAEAPADRPQDAPAAPAAEATARPSPAGPSGAPAGAPRLPSRTSARPADDGGPPTARIDLTTEPPVVEDGDLLDELRKAVGDGEPPSPSTDPADAVQAFFEAGDAELELERRSRFGRRG